MSKSYGRSSFSLEPLESRRLLSVSLDDQGWTQVTPSTDTRKIYVSSAVGNDANDGLSPATSVQSIARGASLLRDGAPDWLLLRRGDVWNEALGNWKKSGRSADEPMLISSYGTAARRPILQTGDSNGIYTQSNPVNYLSIIGIHLYASARDPLAPDFVDPNTNVIGIRFLTSSKDLLIEDTVVQGYSTNIFISPEISGPISDVNIRRSIVIDSFAVLGHSAGALLGGIDGLTLEGNLFDHNGWNDLVPGAEPTSQNHNVYIVQDNKNVVVTDNIIANASSHGLQARSGGIITNNLFINNPIAMSFGLVNGSLETPGGVSGRVEGNIFTGSGDIDGQARGYAMEVGNIRPGGDTHITGNLFLGDQNTTAPAIQLSYGKTSGLPSGTVGINDLTIDTNIFFGWAQALYTNPNLIPGTVGPTALNNLTVRDNDFQQMTQPQMITLLGAYDPAQEHFAGNRYYSPASLTNWFSVTRVSMSFDDWRRLIEPTAINQNVAYPDPTHTLASYNATLGGNPDALDFLAAARRQSQLAWNNQYTARSAKSYLQSGFYAIGDANLDHSVSIADFIILLSNFDKPGQDWDSGDFNLDGSVTVSDLIDLAANFDAAQVPAPAATVETTSPQPASDLALQPIDLALDLENNDLLVGSPTPGGNWPRCLNRGGLKITAARLYKFLFD